jgi:hypothetical protein
MWAFVSYISYGLRVPFSTRWLVRIRQPRRGQWVAIEDFPHHGIISLTLARVVAVPGDEIILDDTVFVNGSPTGIAGPGSESGASTATMRSGEYLLTVQDDLLGLRLHRAGKHSIRGTVHPCARGRRLGTAVGAS